MHLLSYEDHGTLLKLLFRCDSKTFTAIQAEFGGAFTTQGERFSACCAALLLLEDTRALSTAQRLGSWFLVHEGVRLASHGSKAVVAALAPAGLPSPFAGYLLEVAADPRRSAVERHLVRQLLSRHQLAQLYALTPLDYALGYHQALAAGAPDIDRLRADLGAGPCPGSSQEIDALLQAKRQHLVALAASLYQKQQQQPQPQQQPQEVKELAVTAPTPSPPPPPGFGVLQVQQANGRRVGHDASPGGGDTPPVANTGHPPPHGLLTPDAVVSPATPGAFPPALPLVAPHSAPGPGLNVHTLPASHPISDPGSSAEKGTSLGAEEARSTGTAAPSGDGGAGGGSALVTSLLRPGSGASAQPVRELVERALAGPLLPSQQAVVLAALAADADALAALGVGPPQLPLLVEHTPAIAAELLLRLAAGRSPALPDYLGVLATSDMSLHSMEVVNRLTMAADPLPQDFLNLYITNCIQSCENTQDKYVQSRLVRLLCVFLQALARSRAVQLADVLHAVLSFCVTFSRVREAAKLFRLLKQIEGGGRLLGGGDNSPGSPTSVAGEPLADHVGQQAAGSSSSRPAGSIPAAAVVRQ